MSAARLRAGRAQPRASLARRGLVGLLSAAGLVASEAWAGGIQTDVALTPPQGTLFLRQQYRGARTRSEASNADVSTFRTTAVYGVRENLALFGSMAVVHASGSDAGGAGATESGVTDLALLGRYRFLQVDWVAGTLRAAILGGFTVPTASAGFGSDLPNWTGALSLTWRRGPWSVDASFQGSLNPEDDGVDPGETARYDFACGYQFPLAGGRLALLPVLELNVESAEEARRGDVPVASSGGTQFFVSPGLQIPFQVLILEWSVQVPVADNFAATRPADDLRWTAGALLNF